ncbi:hypothetical protein KOR42_43210 [Thalassoglobus neptunius]|uniref:Uncharacterized protein n=1 Tax=Thalassoglobus neptunius TaxID=1938619 RepID=A0A5C5W911_9PLAN|nr:hypothetical protein [Thalassoglobus neptunius]TWT46977.1 hypothetical protein KOR42_43210 [Thalassoglobus neptunius]
MIKLHLTRNALARNARLLLTITSLAVFFAGNREASAEQNLTSLLSKLPDSTNSIIAVDADRLRNSPLGKQENWESANEAAYVNSPFLMPPESDLFILASQINPDADFRQNWEIAIMSLSEPITTRSIARSEGGQIDDISGVPSVLAPSNSYFLNFADDLLAVVSPANRQSVSRWADAIKAGTTGDLNSYLTDSANQLLGDSQIVLVMDLENAVNPFRLKQNLSQSEFVKGNAEKEAKWQQLIQTLKGIALTVQVDTAIHGKLHIDFGTSPSVLGSDAKAAVTTALNNFGLGLESMSDWTLDQSGNQLRLEGELTKSDLRQIMSLIEHPSANFSLLKDEQPAGENEGDKVAEASKQYFQSVDTLLNDLEHAFRTNRDARDSYPRTYMQRYAKRIDNLPILNVDNDLINYGLKVAETLRSVSVTQGRANIEGGVATSGVTSGFTSNGYGYGVSYSSARYAQQRKNYLNRQAQAGAKETRFSSWADIQDATAQIRVEMTKKYKTEF